MRTSHGVPFVRRPVVASVAIILRLWASPAAYCEEDAIKYDIAAFYWPAYHDEERWRPFFRGTEGEWEIIRNARPKFPGHWQPHVPMWGYEQENDPLVMEKKIDAAASHGVNVFIFDWYWYDNKPFLEEAINDGFLKARNNDRVKFYLMWANHDAKTVWNIETSHEKKVIWPGAVDRKTFEIVVERVIRLYMKHPSHYKIDGKPVFSVYDLANLIKGLGGMKQTRDAMDYFDREVKRAGFPGLHFQGILWGKLPKTDDSGFGSRGGTQAGTIEALGIDSLTNYQYVHLSRPVDDYIKWCDRAIANWPKWDREFPVPFSPHVSIGWDNNPRFKAYKGCVKRGVNPENFKKYLHKAKAYVDAHPDEPNLITINSWNEWGEGSYLEPDMKFGMQYLEAVREVFVHQKPAPGASGTGKWKLTASSSHDSADWGLNRLADGNTSSVSGSKGYSSGPHKSERGNEWIEIDLLKTEVLKKLVLHPRTDTKSADGRAAGFPVELVVSLSADGGDYEAVETCGDIPDPAGKTYEITLRRDERSTKLPCEGGYPCARYIRLDVPKLGLPAADEPGVYRLQLAELEVVTGRGE